MTTGCSCRSWRRRRRRSMQRLRVAAVGAWMSGSAVVSGFSSSHRGLAVAPSGRYHKEWPAISCHDRPLSRRNAVVIALPVDYDLAQNAVPLRPPELSDHDVKVKASSTLTPASVVTVPTTLAEALRVFWLGPYWGPRLCALAIVGVAGWRVAWLPLMTALDVVTCGGLVVLWWLQEHWMHKHVLHSKFNWHGKQIHETHHQKPYFHISIDPAPLMLGWLFTAHLILKALLPLPLALSATIGYAGAGLFYEWSHYIVHTRVSFRKPSYWTNMKDHHARHHLIDCNNWLGFSVPAVDDLFGTNPTVQEVRQRSPDLVASLRPSER